MSDATIPWVSTSEVFDDMWINDPERDTAGVPDILATLFRQQEHHMAEYVEIQHTTPKLEPHGWGKIDDPLVQAKIRESAGYMVEELYEAINHLKNKPWKQTMQTTPLEAFREELADAWHFFIELHIIAGLTAEDVFAEYFKKTLINVARREGGY